MWMDAYVHEILIRQQIAESEQQAARQHLVRGARPRRRIRDMVTRLARRLAARRIVRRLVWRRA